MSTRTDTTPIAVCEHLPADTSVAYIEGHDGRAVMLVNPKCTAQELQHGLAELLEQRDEPDAPAAAVRHLTPLDPS